jgi:molecular chaperone DnaJ
MNKAQAFKLFELSQNSTPEEIKKKYKELVKLHHPDRNENKEQATNKIKEINEAYSLLSNKTSPKPQEQIHENIFISTTISFKESVLGSKKQFTYNRIAKCNPCNGHGKIPKPSDCKKCNGTGKITNKQGSKHNQMVFIQTCDQCHGKQEFIDCQNCFQSGSIGIETSINVSIPIKIKTDSTIRLSNMGNFVGSSSFGFMSMEQYTDLFINISVTPDPNFYLDEQNNIIHDLQISLLDALQGKEVSVPTIHGEEKITVPPKSKNKDKITIQNLPDYQVNLIVNYPEDVSQLVSFLGK